MIGVKSMTVAYGEVTALKNVSVHVRRGEFVSLIGSNGAGKTSLLSAMMAMAEVKEGGLELDGVDISCYTTTKIVKAGMTLVPEGRRVFKNLSVIENIEMGGYLRSRKDQKESLEMVMGLFPVLAERAGQAAGMLSGGEQQMLAIGRALMSRPKILLMDEPSMGLAPLIIKDVYEKLCVLKEQGLTIFLVEQNARMALKYADRGYVLENGRIVLQGTGSELLDDNEIKRAYLGKEYREKWER